MLGLIVFLFLFSVFLMTHKFGVEYRYSQGKGQLRLWLNFFGLKVPISVPAISVLGSKVRFRIRQKSADIEADAGIDYASIWKLVKQPLPKPFSIMITKFAYVFREVDTLKWEIKFSTGDSYLTALATGLMWSLSGGLLGVMQEVGHFYSSPVVKVQPVFTKPQFELDFCCIFRVRLGYIILEGIKDLYLYLRQLIGRKGIRV